MREHRPRQPEKRRPDATEAAAGGQSRVDFVMERYGSIQDAGRSFDIEYWQRLGDAAIYSVAWELVEFYHRSRGMGPDELRLQRSLEDFQRA